MERTEKYNPVASMNHPVKLTWKIDSFVSKGIKDAQIFVDQLIGDSDLGVIHFNDFGSDWIKKYGRFFRLTSAKVSPDAFVQICLQLTYYRINRKLAPTYETASVRKYAHGRTETCRSLSLELANFVKIFDDPHIKV
jgi:carnitine O-acetyltransferase